MNARYRNPDAIVDETLENTAPDDERAAITILRGDPTPDELAAVTAVLAAMAEQSADDATRESLRAESAWQRSTRSPREPLRPGPGAWRAFSG